MGLRILWFANTPACSSGYGVQGRYLLPQLQKRGHEVGILAFYGQEGGMQRANGMPIYPKGNDPYGNDIVQPVGVHFGADILITLLDAWVLKEFPQKAPHARWLAWCPVDSEPVPPPVVDALRGAYYALPYSQHGYDELVKAGLCNHYGETNVRYIPHGQDPRVYHPPVSAAQKADAKKSLGFPENCFLAGMVAANKGFPPRKCFDRQFEAFARFRERHPDAYLYCHADPTTIYGGMDLVAEAQSYGLPAGAIRFPDRFLNWLGFPDTWMARMYQALDVYLGATGGEGWGIPIVEAEACGVPAVVTDFTAMRQHVVHQVTGYKVRVAATWKTPLKSYQALPDIQDIVEGLEWAYQQPRQPNVQAVEYARQYEWGRLVDQYWQPLFEEIENRIDPRSRVEKAPIHELSQWLVDSFYEDYQGVGPNGNGQKAAGAPLQVQLVAP